MQKVNYIIKVTLFNISSNYQLWWLHLLTTLTFFDISVFSFPKISNNMRMRLIVLNPSTKLKTETRRPVLADILNIWSFI